MKTGIYTAKSQKMKGTVGMRNNIQSVCKVIEQMDIQLREYLLKKDGEVQKKKLWENTHIKHQIDRRNNGDRFLVSDHIRGMVYSMLSSGISWERVEQGIDENTGNNLLIDNIFYEYDPMVLLSSSPAELADQVKSLNCGSQSTNRQIQALIHTNIRKFMSFEDKYGSVDEYYQTFAVQDPSLKTLVKNLSDSDSADKMKQMGAALTAEYLRNVGYDIAKPDRHICRILGCKYLGCSDQEEVPVFDAFDIVRELAEYMGRKTAEVDYILWSYCARGYGEICTKNKPKCERCAARQICNTKEGENL